MNQRSTLLSPIDLNQAIINCIAHKHPVCITKKNNENWQVYKTTLASSSLKNNITTGEHFLIYGEEGDFSGEVGVSFRRGHHKLLFCCTLRDKALTWPTKVMKISRRAYDRRCPNDNITVRFWTAKNPTNIYGQLEDISTGGMQVSTRVRECNTGSYLCSIDHPTPIRVDAILRNTKLNGDKRRTLSFQFVGLEFNPQTASKLIKLTRAILRPTDQREKQKL